MVDGTYEVTLKVLFTTQKGVVTLASDGETCTATVDAMGNTQTFEGTAQGDSFSFSGKIAGPTGDIDYEVTGTADGETLDARAKTPLGNLRISGTRAQG